MLYNCYAFWHTLWSIWNLELHIKKKWFILSERLTEAVFLLTLSMSDLVSQDSEMYQPLKHILYCHALGLHKSKKRSKTETQR